MFGIGPTELVIIGLLALIVFGPTKAASMARDFGRFVSGARDTVEEFKSELVSPEEVNETRRTTEELKDELISPYRSVEEEFEKGELISLEDLNAPAASTPRPEEEQGKWARRGEVDAS